MDEVKLKKRQLFKMAVKERLYRRRFILPNAVTLGGMYFGFIACIYAAAGFFEKSAYAIMVAIVLDGLDGRVARKFNATSKFGVELDSFADLVSFGIAPAFLVYHWCFKPTADEFGVMVVFVYALCAASRLARFNISVENLKSFTGLPTPGAAALVVSIVNFIPYVHHSRGFIVIGSALMLVLAYLMVSTTDFFSIKLLRMRTLGFFARVYLGGLIALIGYDPRVGLLALSASYVLSGPLKALFSKKPRADDPPAEAA